MIISHIRTSDRAIQTNEEHQLGVAERAEMFASSFGCGALGRIMGLLHDKGKEQIAWQHYIMGEMVYDKKSSHLVNRPNHAYVGALMAKKFYPLFSPLISQPIAGHHRGLYDYCDYEEVMKQDIPEEVELDIIPPIDSFTLPRMKPSDLHHLVRMLFSCLVDADSLDLGLGCGGGGAAGGAAGGQGKGHDQAQNDANELFHDDFSFFIS